MKISDPPFLEQPLPFNGKNLNQPCFSENLEN